MSWFFKVNVALAYGAGLTILEITVICSRLKLRQQAQRQGEFIQSALILFRFVRIEKGSLASDSEK